MRFYQEFDGIIWEFTSIKDYLLFRLFRLLGQIVGIFLVIVLAILAYDWLVSL